MILIVVQRMDWWGWAFEEVQGINDSSLDEGMSMETNAQIREIYMKITTHRAGLECGGRKEGKSRTKMNPALDGQGCKH